MRLRIAFLVVMLLVACCAPGLVGCASNPPAPASFSVDDAGNIVVTGINGVECADVTVELQGLSPWSQQVFPKGGVVSLPVGTSRTPVTIVSITVVISKSCGGALAGTYVYTGAPLTIQVKQNVPVPWNQFKPK